MKTIILVLLMMIGINFNTKKETVKIVQNDSIECVFNNTINTADTFIVESVDFSKYIVDYIKTTYYTPEMEYNYFVVKYSMNHFDNNTLSFKEKPVVANSYVPYKDYLNNFPYYYHAIYKQIIANRAKLDVGSCALIISNHSNLYLQHSQNKLGRT